MSDLLPPSPSALVDSPRHFNPPNPTNTSIDTPAKAAVASDTEVYQLGPPVQPLDYAALMAPDQIQPSLKKVIQDFTQWLTAIENGLNHVLEEPAEG